MNEKILISLSDIVLSNTLDSKLKELGYKTYIARDGKDALDKIRTLMPDLLLLDTVLSGRNGYEVLQEKNIDTKISRIPVIVISNSGTSLQMQQIPNTPSIKDYIIKTHIDINEVIEKVYKVFGKKYDLNKEQTNPTKIGQGKKVLWVEDDKLLSAILVKKFETTGYNLLKASNGEEAFKILETEVPDIILLDILLPEMSGFDVLQKIKTNENLRKVPVIMLSNLSKQSDIDKAKLLGANRFIVKAAASLDEIIKEVDSLIK